VGESIMTAFDRIMSELSLGRSTDYIRRVARKERVAKALDSTQYKAITRVCNLRELARRREWVL
jgi:hypothetical protein